MKELILETLDNIKKRHIRIIRDLTVKFQVAFVSSIIAIGNELLLIKKEVGHGEWIPFVKSELGISIRSCQNYMKLAKTPIDQQNYRYGMEGLLELMRIGVDLSKPVKF
jgi:hypothetical protein